MPFEVSFSPAPATRIGPSAALELYWLAIRCRKSELRTSLPPEVGRRGLTFWDDGEAPSVELLILAQQLGCLTGWDAAVLFDLEHVRVTPLPTPSLETEPPEERRRVAARLRRLAHDAELRQRYGELLRELWTHAEPDWLEHGRPAVQRALDRLGTAQGRGRPLPELLPEAHLARRPDLAGLIRAGVAGPPVLTPVYFAGDGGHVIALPGAMLIGMGTGGTTDLAQRRSQANQVADRLRLFGDPTRLLILQALAGRPLSVGDLAREVAVAQATASVHVRLLRDAGLIEALRQGGRTVYMVRGDGVHRALDAARAAVFGQGA